MLTEKEVYNTLLENNKNLDNILVNTNKSEYFFNILYKTLPDNTSFDENNQEHMYIFISNMNDVFFPEFKYSAYQNKWYFNKKNNLNMELGHVHQPYYGLCSHNEPIKELTTKDIRIFLQYILYNEIVKYYTHLQEVQALQKTLDNNQDECIEEKIKFFINFSKKCQTGAIFFKYIDSSKLFSL